MKSNWKHAVAVAASLLLFGLALSFLHRTANNIQLDQVLVQFRSLPVSTLITALLLVAASYVLLTGYDVLALRYVGRRLPYPTVALAAVVGFAFSHNLGLGMVTGGSVRYRIYSKEGLGSVDIATVVMFSTLTFVLGAVATVGAAFILAPDEAARILPVGPDLVRGFGVIGYVGLGAYLAWTIVQRQPRVWFHWTLQLPTPSTTLAQVSLAALEIAVSAAVLYVMLPPVAQVSYPAFVGIFVTAMVAGLASHVPGGLGVIETVLVLQLPDVRKDALLGSLLAWRCVYYLVPLTFAALLMAGAEFGLQRHRLTRLVAAASVWLEAAAPAVIGAVVFLGGAVLLISGATPAVDSRMQMLAGWIPLGIIEASHLLGSVTGAGLLILAHGLFRRSIGAHRLAQVLVTAGIVFSLAKGLDLEEAIVLAVILLVLRLGRAAFHRRSSLLEESFTPEWIVFIAMVMLATLWVGVLSYRHLPYRADMWWQFALDGDASRFLRATLAVTVALSMFAAARVVRGRAPRFVSPTAEALDRVARIVVASAECGTNVALLGDKALLFSDSGESFVMYRVQGPSWVALGDPVGRGDELQPLVWRYRELCERFDGRPVFYQVSHRHLPEYVDLGLAPMKIGDEAVVELGTFTLQGPERADVRHNHRRAVKRGLTFEIFPPAEVPALLADLRRVSSAWLHQTGAAEQGFCQGYYSEPYILRFPTGVVREGGKLIAFCIIWLGAGRSEMSFDLVRYDETAPAEVMDFLIVELIRWAQQQGFRGVNLGVAPLTGLDRHRLAPTWRQAGHAMFPHGAHFDSFQALRRYKERFAPQWHPRYLVAPGGPAIAETLLDVAAAAVRRGGAGG